MADDDERPSIIKAIGPLWAWALIVVVIGSVVLIVLVLKERNRPVAQIYDYVIERFCALPYSRCPPSSTAHASTEREPMLQTRCLKAIIAKDSELEPGSMRARAREEIADSVLRLRETDKRRGKPPRTYCDILKAADTFFPDGWPHERAWIWKERDVEVIEGGIDEATLLAAEKVAAAKFEARPAAGRCATKYVRGSRTWTSWLSDEIEGASALERSMRPDPALSSEGFRTKFLCDRS